ncbi:MAG: hypothetical protein ACAI43_14030 [Phycisphaerae bacterium]
MNTRLITLIFSAAWTTAAIAADAPKVLVVPFDGAGPADKAWIAKALQQNLVAELSRVNSVEPVTSGKVLADKAAALNAAKEMGAQFVVFGAYQVVEADLRITGQVLDVGKNQTVAGLKATGAQRDLFGLEDVIATQVKRALPAPFDATPEMLRHPAPGAAAPAVAAPAPAGGGAAAVPVMAPVVGGIGGGIPGYGPAARGEAAAIAHAMERVDELEARLEGAMDRIRYLDESGGGYRSTYYSPFYGGYGYGYGWGYVPQYNVAVIGGWSGAHSHGRYHIGAGTGTWAGAVPDGRNYAAPTGNYAVHPGNYIKPTVRR